MEVKYTRGKQKTAEVGRARKGLKVVAGAHPSACEMDKRIPVETRKMVNYARGG